MNLVDMYCEDNGVEMPPGNVQDAVNRWAIEKITQLRAEVERLKKIKKQPDCVDCVDCGHVLTEVRPGKHQCDWCELERENQQLKTAILKTLEENGHLADGDNCTLISLKQAIGAV